MLEFYWRGLGDVLRHAFSLPLHDAIGVKGVLVAGFSRAQEKLRRLGVIRLLPAERHHAEIVKRARMVLRRRALELLLGRGGILGEAARAFEQQRAEFERSLRV